MYYPIFNNHKINDIENIDKIVCSDTIEDISFRSPPSSRASAYAEDAVGIDANKTNKMVVSLSNSKSKQVAYIITGKSISFANEETATAIFVSFIEDKCNPTPTDKSPKGSAAELKIDKVFSKSDGKLSPSILKDPPKRQAKIRGFLNIDFKSETVVILLFGTYNANIEIHKIFRSGMMNVINNIPNTKFSSLKSACVRAKNT